LDDLQRQIRQLEEDKRVLAGRAEEAERRLKDADLRNARQRQVLKEQEDELLRLEQQAARYVETVRSTSPPRVNTTAMEAQRRERLCAAERDEARSEVARLMQENQGMAKLVQERDEARQESLRSQQEKERIAEDLRAQNTAHAELLQTLAEAQRLTAEASQREAEANVQRVETAKAVAEYEKEARRWQDEVTQLLERRAEEEEQEKKERESDRTRAAAQLRACDERWRDINVRLQTSLDALEQRARSAEAEKQLCQEELQARRVLDGVRREKEALSPSIVASPASMPVPLSPPLSAKSVPSGRVAFRDDLRQAVFDLTREVNETKSRLRRI